MDGPALHTFTFGCVPAAAPVYSLRGSNCVSVAYYPPQISVTYLEGTFPHRIASKVALQSMGLQTPWSMLSAEPIETLKVLLVDRALYMTVSKKQRSQCLVYRP